MKRLYANANRDSWKSLKGALTTFSLLAVLGCGSGFPKSSLLTPTLSPSLLAVNPNTVVAGAPSTTITVAGTNLDGANSIMVNNTPFPASAASSSTLVAMVNGSMLQKPGELNISVKNGAGDTSNALALRIVAPLQASSGLLAAAQVGTAYASAGQVIGGTAPYVWSLVSGSVPSGLIFHADGSITGTPLTSGTSAFTVSVADSGNPSQTTAFQEQITVAPSNVVITSVNASSAQVGTAYLSTAQVTGGTPPYIWSLASGTLPVGLSFHADGSISGTPTSSGTSTFSVSVADSSSPSQTSSAKGSITVASSALAITSANLGQAQVGTAYSSTANASGGTGSYTWAITSGSLPQGLSLDGSSGTISGTPTTNGNSTFTLTVSDNGSPAQQSSLATTLTVSVAALKITTAGLASASVNTPYSASLQATGGAPNYTWSLASGALPAGMILASDGTLSGTSSVAGTASFSVRVTDASSPAQTQTAMFSLAVGQTTFAAVKGTTWYVRADGGTRYSTNNRAGQCDGKHDAAYPGSGINQPCAFGDYRYLYDDQHTYPAPTPTTWAIAGGDTVIIDVGVWRVGHQQGVDANDAWCFGTGNSVCYNPPVPAGTATQHTRILGRNYASCSAGQRADHAKMSTLSAGFGAYAALNLQDTQYVDVQCIEATSFTNCQQHGTPLPNPCRRNYPASDFGDHGVLINSNTDNVTMQDMWIHSVAAYGIYGNVAGSVSANRVDIAYTGSTGINLDDGTESNSPTGVFTFNYGSIMYAGCAPEYPATHAVPISYCYDQNSANNGDGLGTANVSGIDLHMDHNIFAFNTEDCIDPGHVYVGNHTLTLTNNLAFGCMGATFKWGAAFTNATVTGNILIANCARMSVPISGAPSTYNTYLSLFCRAGDATSFNFRNGGVALVANNTFAGTAGIFFDVHCADSGGSCPDATLTFRNNLVRAYADPLYPNYNGGPGPAGMTISGVIGRYYNDHNIFHGPMRNQACLSIVTGDLCVDPVISGFPSTFVDETSLDPMFTVANDTLAATSPARAAGIPIDGLLVDMNGTKYSVPPSLGAIEYQPTTP